MMDINDINAPSFKSFSAAWAAIGRSSPVCRSRAFGTSWPKGLRRDDIRENGFGVGIKGFRVQASAIGGFRLGF